MKLFGKVNILLGLLLVIGSLISVCTAAPEEGAPNATTQLEGNESACTVTMKDNASAKLTHFDNFRGIRYCEVFLTCDKGGTSFYNTLGLNNEMNPRDTCPDSIMANFSTEAVKKQYNTSAAALNPPRYFVMDAGNITVAPTVRDFDGLKARWMGTLQEAAAFGETPYVPMKIGRDSTWFFDKGKPVFLLDDPNDTSWIMKSYTNSVDKNLTYENLTTLNTKLKLPPGWSYRSKVLETNITMVPVNGTARITQDDLGNVYDSIDNGTTNYKP